ncbi:MAG: putative Ig domain-containing protein [Planctomycetes bacterium]|nr:putative Ig domain-containing protein [Planctomycetota bacterium]
MTTLSGVPQYSTVYTFTLRVTDSASNTAIKSFQVYVAPGGQPVAITTTNPLPNARIQAAFSTNLQVTSGTPGYIWHLDSGALPPGLSFGSPVGSTWTLSGTPTSLGSFQFTVSVTNLVNQRAVKTFDLTVAPPPSLTITSSGTLPNGETGMPYSQDIFAYGGTQAGFQWTLTAGSLPPGLIFTPTGTPYTTVSGTPATVGNYVFELTVTDSASNTTFLQFSITVNPPPGVLGILTQVVPDGAIGAAYSQQITATGGFGSYTWSIVAGALPAGLSISSGTPAGTISGTPTTAGIFNFTVQVTDALSATAQQAFSVEVSSYALRIQLRLPAEAQAGQSYSDTFAAEGGAAPYSWSLASGALPAGIGLSSGTPSATLSGTPAAAGVYYARLRVRDSLGWFDYLPLRFIVRPAAAGALTIINTTLPDIDTGSEIHEPLIAAGGTPPYTWSVVGVLPGSLQLLPSGDYAALRGNTSGGTAVLTIQVSDSASNVFQRVLNLNVLGIFQSMTDAFGPATVGTPANFSIATYGGTGAFTWNIIEGALPAGMTLTPGTPDATVSGTPTQAGGYFFRVRVVDASGWSFEQTIVGEVVPAGVTLGLDVAYSSRMASGATGSGYYDGVFPTGGTGPYTWRVKRGYLPKGLSFSASQTVGYTVVQGTAQMGGYFVVIIEVTDTSTSTSVERALHLGITPGGPVFSTLSLPNASWGAPYNQSITCTQVLSSGITWLMHSGSLPPGMSLNMSGDPSTTLSGTCSVSGNYTFELSALGPSGTAPYRQFSVNVTGGPKLQFLVQPTNTIAGQVISPPVQVEITDGSGTRIPTATNAVTIALDQNPSASTLGGTLTVNAVAGVATFNNLTLSIAMPGAQHTLRATATGLTDATSWPFQSLNPAAAGVRLGFVAQPSNTVAGQNIAPAITVEVQDAYGLRDTSSTASVTLAIDFNAGGATLSGTLTQAAVAGLATFSTVSLNRSGAGYTLKASATGLQGAVSAGFSITHDVASKLLFIESLYTFETGVPYSLPVRVQVCDAFDNRVLSATHLVTLTDNPASGAYTLSGTTAVNAVNGIATFNGLIATAASGQVGCTILANASGLSQGSSTQFRIVNGRSTSGPIRAKFVSEPLDCDAGQTFSVVVELVQQGDIRAWGATNNVTLSIWTSPMGPGPSASLSGTLTVACVDGRATFSGLSINRAGGFFQLRGVGAGMPGGWPNPEAISRQFSVRPGAASQVIFATQPTEVNVSTAFNPDVEAQLADSFGNYVTSGAPVVSVAINTNPGAASLLGNSTVSAAGGRARFIGLGLTQPGRNYRLSVSSAGLSSAMSNQFHVVGPAAVLIQISGVTPNNAMPNTPLSMTFEISDVAGTRVTTGTYLVTVDFESNPGATTLSGTLSASSSSGTVSFSNVRVQGPGQGFKLVATATGLAPGVTGLFNVAGPLANMRLNGVNTDIAAGVASSFPIQLLDAFGTVMTNATNTVSVALGANPGGSTLSGTTSAAAISGLASFPNLSINNPGSGYTLVFTCTGLPNLVVGPFDVVAATTPYSLAVVTQPQNTYVGGTFGCAVRIRDVSGSTLTSSTLPVTIALFDEPQGATLAGTMTVNAVNGVATFAGLSCNKKGTALRLVAACGNLKTALSSTFNVEGAPVALAVTNQPRNSLALNNAGPISFRIIDADGDPVTRFNTSVTLSLSGGTGGALLGSSPTSPASTTNGSVSFTNVNVDLVGAGCVITAAATGLTSAATEPFDIVAAAGTPARLSINLQGSSGKAGVVLNPAPQIAVRDALNTLLTTATTAITASVYSGPGGAALGGTVTVNAVNGIATFSNLIPNMPGTFVIRYSAGGCTPVNSINIIVGAASGSATKLVFAGVSGGYAVNQTISPSITVLVLDAFDNQDYNYSTPITIALLNNPGGATLSGTLNLVPSSGAASFSTLSLNVIGNGYTLAATSGSLTLGVSPAFNIGTPGVAAKLSFYSQPPSAAAPGVAFASPVRVQVVDVRGVMVPGATNAITLSFAANPASATLGGTVTVNAVAGVATFNGLSISAAAIGYRLLASSGSFVTATSQEIDVGNAGVSAALRFSLQPASAQNGMPLDPVTKVKVIDVYGNVVTGATNSITLALPAAMTGATLSGTLSVAAVSGEATFSNVILTGSAGSYRFEATSGALKLATSNLFSLAVAPTSVAFAQQPSNVVAGAYIWAPVKVEFRDGAGVRLTSLNRVVTIALGSNPGGSALSGTLSVQAVNGVAVFTNLWLNKAATGYTLVASTQGLSSVVSTAFNVLAGTPVGMTFTVQPANGVSGVALSPAPTVAVADAYGNPAVGATGMVQITLAANPGDSMLLGTLQVALSQGQAVFPDLALLAPASGYSLSATLTGYSSATSANFDISAGAPKCLLFRVQPSWTASGNSISPAVQIEIRDMYGALCATATNSVTISLGANPGGATLSGTLTQAAVGGVASFSNLSLNSNSVGYTLVVSAAGIAGATSRPFDIAANPKPVVHELWPPMVRGGITAAIYGTGFSTTPANNNVSFGGVGATVTSASTQKLVVSVPLSVASGNLTVTVAGRTSAVFAYQVGPVRCNFADSGAQDQALNNSWSSASPDGRYVIFSSTDTALVTGDTNFRRDVFLRDTVAGTTARVSVGTGGSELNGDSTAIQVSADGRYVLFTSDADNISTDPRRIAGKPMTYLHDRQANTTMQVGTLIDKGSSNAVGVVGSLMTADGRYVVFTRGQELGAGWVNGQPTSEIVFLDLQSGVAQWFFPTLDGSPATVNLTLQDMTPDGRYILFQAADGNFISGDTNGYTDIFVHDRISGTTTRVSTGLAGAQPNQECNGARISANGRFVVFSSIASNIVSGDTNTEFDVFLRDLHTANTERVSLTAAGAQSAGYSSACAVSDDGKIVVFGSQASDLVPGDTNGFSDLFVRDRAASTTVRISVSSSGGQADYGVQSIFTMLPRADGIYCNSGATNLVSGDTNSNIDVFFLPMSMTSRVGPRISALAPGIAMPGGSLEIFGHGFSSVVSANTVLIGGVSASVSSASFTRLVVILPAAAVDGPVLVANSDQVSNPATLRVGVRRASVDASGTQANGASQARGISTDGRYALFSSAASNLVAGDTNGLVDVFVKDALTGKIERVSMGLGGAEPNAECLNPSMSGDGRIIAFESDATNLVAGDTNGVRDIFVYDRARKIMRIYSKPLAGGQSDGHSRNASLSSDGSYVAFESDATNLVAGDTNGVTDIFVAWFWIQCVRFRLSVDSSGNEANGSSFKPRASFSADVVVFESDATNLVAGDTNGVRDIFVHRRGTAATTRISVATGGAQANAASSNGSISADGTIAVFQSDASNLVTGDTNNRTDVFVFSVAGAVTSRASLDSAGVQGNDDSTLPAISAHGRWIVFKSAATNLVTGDTNAMEDIFLRDIQASTTSRQSLSGAGAQGNGNSGSPCISASGDSLFFDSLADNLVSGDTNGAADTFARPRTP